MSATTGQDPHWEKANAPRVTGRQVAVTAAIYAIWLTFLAVLAIRQWLGPPG